MQKGKKLFLHNLTLHLFSAEDFQQYEVLQ